MAPFHPDADIGAYFRPKWRVWLDDFETFIIANGITYNTRKCAILLNHPWPCIRDIFQQLQATGDTTDYNTALEKLTEKFEHQWNKLYEVYKFPKVWNR